MPRSHTSWPAADRVRVVVLFAFALASTSCSKAAPDVSVGPAASKAESPSRPAKQPVKRVASASLIQADLSNLWVRVGPKEPTVKEAAAAYLAQVKTKLALRSHGKPVLAGSVVLALGGGEVGVGPGPVLALGALGAHQVGMKDADKMPTLVFSPPGGAVQMESVSPVPGAATTVQRQFRRMFSATPQEAEARVRRFEAELHQLVRGGKGEVAKVAQDLKDKRLVGFHFSYSFPGRTGMVRGLLQGNVQSQDFQLVIRETSE